MENKTIEKKSKEVLSIERKIKFQLKIASDEYVRSKNTQRKNFYAGAYSSLTQLLESINK